MEHIRDETLRDFGRRNMTVYGLELNLKRSVPDVYDGWKPVQKRILFAASQQEKKYIKAARIVGDCFAKGTLVTLANGESIPVENVIVGDEILTDRGVEYVTKTFVIPDRELYEVDTDQGTVLATPDQIFYCLDESGLEVERTPLTLKPGDRIKTR